MLSDLAANPDTDEYDGVLVACYSVHPLVEELSAAFESRGSAVLVTGIFEASILTSLSLVSTHPGSSSLSQMWGIVTTGVYWERHLADGVRVFLGQDEAAANSKFAGVFSTGLNAGDLHGDVSPDTVRAQAQGSD